MDHKAEGAQPHDLGVVLGLLRRADLPIEDVAEHFLLTTTAREYFLRRGFADCSRETAPPGIRESFEFRSGCPSSAAFLKKSLRPR